MRINEVMSKTVTLTCKTCGNEWDKEIDDDKLIGPHKNVKNGMGLAHRDSDDIVTRKEGYGTMPVVACTVCGGTKHYISS